MLACTAATSSAAGRLNPHFDEFDEDEQHWNPSFHGRRSPTLGQGHPFYSNDEENYSDDEEDENSSATYFNKSRRSFDTLWSKKVSDFSFYRYVIGRKTPQTTFQKFSVGLVYGLSYLITPFRYLASVSIDLFWTTFYYSRGLLALAAEKIQDYTHGNKGSYVRAQHDLSQSYRHTVSVPAFPRRTMVSVLEVPSKTYPTNQDNAFHRDNSLRSTSLFYGQG